MQESIVVPESPVYRSGTFIEIEWHEYQEIIEENSDCSCAIYLIQKASASVDLM